MAIFLNGGGLDCWFSVLNSSSHFCHRVWCIEIVGFLGFFSLRLLSVSDLVIKKADCSKLAVLDLIFEFNALACCSHVDLYSSMWSI